MRLSFFALAGGSRALVWLVLCSFVLAPVAHAGGKSLRTGEVFLFRGTGGVFSGGLVSIAQQFNRRGVKAKVRVHQAWKSVARDIIARSKKRQVSFPIILMGHSAGGRAALKLAKALGEKGLRVKYVVTFDPNTRARVSSNVSRAVNYYLPDKSNSNILLRGRGFRGNIQNVNVSRTARISHLNIDNNDRLHKRVVRTALSYTRRK